MLFDEDPSSLPAHRSGCTPSTSRTPRVSSTSGIPADHLMFGSDFPHPEGMADPLAYSEVVADLTPTTRRSSWAARSAS